MDYKSLRKIEFMKFNWRGYIKQVIIANIVISTMILLTAIMNTLAGPEVKLPVTTFIMIDSLVKSVFIIWQGVLLANIIIEEYQSKTVLLLFSYPLDRKKLIRVKILIVAILIFSAMILSQIFQNLLFFTLDKFIEGINYSITIKDILVCLFTNVSSLLMGMIALYVGMQQRSTIATVITSIIIVSIIVSSSTKSGSGLITVLPIAFILGLVGFLASLRAVENMLSEDIIV